MEMQCWRFIDRRRRTSSAEFKIDPARLTIGGTSAGASIAAALCLLARKRADFVIQLQILVYGCFDSVEPNTSKHIAPDRKQVLTPRNMDFFVNLYLPKTADRRDELASPLHAKDLSGLPRALVITAEFDLLKKDGNSYAAKLLAHGVPVVRYEFPKCDHGFTYYGPKHEAVAALNLMTQELRRAAVTPFP
jgi:acetyl esterase